MNYTELQEKIDAAEFALKVYLKENKLSTRAKPIKRKWKFYKNSPNVIAECKGEKGRFGATIGKVNRLSKRISLLPSGNQCSRCNGTGIEPLSH